MSSLLAMVTIFYFRLQKEPACLIVKFKSLNQLNFTLVSLQNYKEHDQVLFGAFLSLVLACLILITRNRSTSAKHEKKDMFEVK